MWRKNVSAVTLDFEVNEETGKVRVEDNGNNVIGGIITNKVVKTTRTNSMMAFITIEDLVGTVEIIIFPRDYEKYKDLNCITRRNGCLHKIGHKLFYDFQINAFLFCKDIYDYATVWFFINN